MENKNIDFVNYPIIDGIYEHYKGGRYIVITMATETETGEPLVIYKSLLFGSIYARNLKIWNETVEIPTEVLGSVKNKNGTIELPTTASTMKTINRFTYLEK